METDINLSAFVEIRDLGLLTLLRVNGIMPANKRVTVVNAKTRAVYLFKSHELGSMVQDYFEHRCLVDAYHYSRELKKIKQEIYDDKINLSRGNNGNKEGT